MKRKILSMAIALLMIAGSVTGCGNGNGQEKNDNTNINVGENSKESEDNITITVATRYSSDNEDENLYRKKVEEFNNLDNGITIEMDNIATESDYLDKLRTSFANGDTPNVFLEYGGSRCLDYLESDALVDLEPYLKADDSSWYNNFYESFWSMTEYEGYDGIYAVPFKTYMVTLFYNKELFEQADVEPPKSIDDMMELSKTFKDMGILPFQVGEKDPYRFGHFHSSLVIKTLGVDAVDQLANRELSYDSEKMKETYQVMVDMVEKGYFGENILDTDSVSENAQFIEGNVAMHYNGSWFIANELYGTDFYDKVGVVAFPYGDESCKNYAQGGASDMFFVSKLNKSEKEIEASVEFLKFITSPEYFQELDEVAQTIVPVKFEKTENSPENPLLDQVIEIQKEITDLRTDIQNYDPESHMLDTVRSSLQGIAMGDSAEQCATNITNRMKEYGGE